MLVKFARSFGKVKTGMFSSANMFQVYAVVAYAPDQIERMNRHSRWGRYLWLEVPGVEEDQGNWTKEVTFQALKDGTVIHHRNMNVIFEAEEQIIQGLKNEVATCHALDTFTGNGTGETVYEIDGSSHKVVASA